MDIGLGLGLHIRRIKTKIDKNIYSYYIQTHIDNSEPTHFSSAQDAYGSKVMKKRESCKLLLGRSFIILITPAFS